MSFCSWFYFCIFPTCKTKKLSHLLKVSKAWLKVLYWYWQYLWIRPPRVKMLAQLWLENVWKAEKMQPFARQYQQWQGVLGLSIKIQYIFFSKYKFFCSTLTKKIQKLPHLLKLTKSWFKILYWCLQYLWFWPPSQELNRRPNQGKKF